MGGRERGDRVGGVCVRMKSGGSEESVTALVICACTAATVVRAREAEDRCESDLSRLGRESAREKRVRLCNPSLFQLPRAPERQEMGTRRTGGG